MVLLCCVTPYLFDQGSSLVSLHMSTLDQHPETHSLKLKRGHANTFLALTRGKHHAALTMLVEGLIGMLLHRYIQSLQTA